MRNFIFFGFSMLLVLSARSEQGFEIADQKNIFSIRSGISGATASLVNLPNGEQVITTQAHVLDDFKKHSTLKLTWRKFYGRFFIKSDVSEGSFEITFHPEVLWKDDDLDIAFLKVPKDLVKFCNCEGLNTAAYKEGIAVMIGYPQIGVRSYPRVGVFWKHLGALLGTVQQRKSIGKTWINANEHVADLDGLPGNSGSSILDESGNVIGMLHLLKSWYGEGYKYKNPSINLLPIELIIEKYQGFKRGD